MYEWVPAMGLHPIQGESLHDHGFWVWQNITSFDNGNQCDGFFLFDKFILRLFTKRKDDQLEPYKNCFVSWNISADELSPFQSPIRPERGKNVLQQNVECHNLSQNRTASKSFNQSIMISHKTEIKAPSLEWRPCAARFFFFFRSAPEEGLYWKPKKIKRAIFISIKFATSAIGISLPSIFCIWNSLLIQVYKWSGTTHWFVAVKLQILLFLFLSR